ncbi:cell cycle checkpoint protein RAD17 isoform X2 [Danaus plexippus]|uniref:cell cycle checkpoint protein RAD17 isoform X2 n=1 Tax=Danaus plexippus TaxID=13037 RepID=UPI002AB0DB39|nr:cell cycle checkpoint protein RAD17 isoform X2 [Danaus plexippus]
MLRPSKGKKWFKPVFDLDDNLPAKKIALDSPKVKSQDDVKNLQFASNTNIFNNVRDSNWMKNFDPVNIEDLAVNNKKVLELEEWMKNTCLKSNNNILLLSGPVGCGKTASIQTLASKYNIKITEWITPLDIEYPSEYGEYEFKEPQTKKFLEFIINSANFTSLVDNNSCKLVLVEDFPNIFMRTPAEFTEVLTQYKQRAKSPIVFICSESHTDTKNTSFNLFSSSLKEQFQIHHIMFNAVTLTGLKAALKRASAIMNSKFSSTYNNPTNEIIDSVVNSSGGDVRSAILNLHFACLKGSTCNLETSIIKEKESKSKTTTRRKKNVSNKFMTLGKDQTVSILHGVGRVLNPKETVTENGHKTLTHNPKDIIEQFLSHPSSFVNFLHENYLPHFSGTYDVDEAATALSNADCMLAEWREQICQEYGLYTAVSGLMLANKSPVPAWNPVRGPKNMKVIYPTLQELSLLDPNVLYKGKTLVTDYSTYHKIISS